MSLILDALKKSEAERRRGQPPRLNTAHALPARHRRAPTVAFSAIGLIAVGAAGAWLMARWQGPNPVAVPLASAPSAAQAVNESAIDQSTQSLAMATTAPAAMVATDASVATASMPTVETAALGTVMGGGQGVMHSGGGLPSPARAALVTPTVQPAPESLQAVATPLPAAAAPTAAPPAMVPVPAEPAAAVSAPVAAAAAPAVVADSAAPAPAPMPQSVPSSVAPALVEVDPAVPTIHQLAYATRRELPKLDLSMHVYSPRVESRFVVLNGKRFDAESPPPAPDLALVEIVRDGVVLDFRGTRFLLPRQGF